MFTRLYIYSYSLSYSMVWTFNVRNDSVNMDVHMDIDCTQSIVRNVVSTPFVCIHMLQLEGKKCRFSYIFDEKRQKRATIEAVDFMPSCTKKACKIPVKLPSTFRQYSVQLLSIWTSIWTNSLTNYN